MWIILFLALLIVPSFGWGFTITDLNNELVNNPTSPPLNYTTDITTNNNTSLMAKLNLIHNKNEYVVSHEKISHNSFVGDWGDVIQLIPSISDTNIRNKWTWMVQTLLGFVDTIDLTSDTATGFFAQMVSDGLVGAGGTITNANVIARTTRQGSRAEVLWGPGAFVTLNQISCALRSAGC